jgi:transcriptional regulator with XRE-family HTH domain
LANTTVDVAGLYAALDAARTTQGLSWRQLARQLNVSPSTLSRLANDLKPDISAFAAMVTWLRMPAETFVVDPSDPRPGAEEEPDLVASLSPLLRARKDLDEQDVEYLEELISSAVRRFKSDRSGGRD